jgi:hypothetical protein
MPSELCRVARLFGGQFGQHEITGLRLLPVVKITSRNLRQRGIIRSNARFQTVEFFGRHWTALLFFDEMIE